MGRGLPEWGPVGQRKVVLSFQEQWESPDSLQAEEGFGEVVMLEEQRAVGRGGDQGDFSVVLIAATRDLNKGGRNGDGER